VAGASVAVLRGRGAGEAGLSGQTVAEKLVAFMRKTAEDHARADKLEGTAPCRCGACRSFREESRL